MANTIAAIWITAITSTAAAMMPRKTFVTRRAPSRHGTGGPHRPPFRAPHGRAVQGTRAFRRPWQVRTTARPRRPQWRRPQRRAAPHRRRDARLSPSEDAHLDVQVLFRIGLDFLQ